MDSLRAILRWVRIGAIVVGVFLGFAALIEILRAYQVLAAFHPVAGWVFAGAAVAGITALALWLWYVRRRYPVLPISPGVTDMDAANDRELRRYARYLVALLARLGCNALLDESQRLIAIESGEELREATRSSGTDRLRRLSRNCADNVLPSLFVPLDAASERHVRQSVRDVTVGVAVSPWHSVDLMVVVYRNGRMIADVVRTYTVRPGLREELLVLRDVATVVATVNFLNYGSRLLQSLGANIPLLGRFTDDIAQGIGAGLMTSVAGHAAIDRCRSFHGWQKEEARARMVSRLGEFLGDLRQIATTDLAASFRERLRCGRAATGDRGPADEDFADSMCEGLGRAMDDTTSAMDQFVRRPAVAVGRGVASTGQVVGRGTISGLRFVTRPFRHVFRKWTGAGE